MENKAVNFGLISGGAIVVIMFVVDMIDSRMMVNFMMSYFPTLVLIVAMVFSVREARRDVEYLDFTGAFKAAFLPFVIGNGIYLVFNYVLYNFIDPGLADLAREKALELFDRGLLNNLMNEEDRELMLEATRENSFRPTLSQSFLGYMFSLVFPGGVVSLVLATIFRSRKG